MYKHADRQSNTQTNRRQRDKEKNEIADGWTSGNSILLFSNHPADLLISTLSGPEVSRCDRGVSRGINILRFHFCRNGHAIDVTIRIEEGRRRHGNPSGRRHRNIVVCESVPFRPPSRHPLPLPLDRGNEITGGDDQLLGRLLRLTS